MITRKLLAALVGLSLAAGTLGAASAQTPAPQTTEMAAPGTAQAATPSEAMSPATAKSKPMKKTTHRKGHMAKKMHRKHVSSLATKGTKVAAKHTGKRVRVSHAKRGTTKQV